MNNVDLQKMYDYRSFSNSESSFGNTGYRSFNNSESSFGNTGLNVDYQHSMKRKGEYLTASYKFNNSPNDSEAETYYDDITDVPFRLTDQYYNNDAHTAEHVGLC